MEFVNWFMDNNCIKAVKISQKALDDVKNDMESIDKNLLAI
jgi:hypothetical protein